MRYVRQPKLEELRFLKNLIAAAGLTRDSNWYNDLQIRPFMDGGMGGFEIINKSVNQRKFDKCIYTYEFLDKDEVIVIPPIVEVVTFITSILCAKTR